MQFYNTVPILGRKPGEIIQGWRTSFMPAAQDGPVARMSMVMILNSSLALAESNWTYYKVWPEYVDMFLKTRLDNIPPGGRRSISLDDHDQRYAEEEE